MFVEVQETHVALPGPGTIRRWRREAPEGFQFALLGPREVGQEGFRDGKVVETALRMLSSVAKELDQSIEPKCFTDITSWGKLKGRGADIAAPS